MAAEQRRVDAEESAAASAQTFEERIAKLEEDEANLRIEAATTQHGLEERIRALEAEAVVHARQFQSLTLTTLDFFSKSLNVK